MNKNIISSDKRKTAPIIAFLMSIILVGTGQMINGQWKKGLLMLAICAMVNIVFIQAELLYGSIISLVLYFYSGFDAYKLAKALKNGEEVSEFKFFY